MAIVGEKIFNLLDPSTLRKEGNQMIYANSKRKLLLGLTFSGALYSTPSIAVNEGVDVLPEDAPYMVYLESSHCSGALIAPKTVLTATHCIWKTNKGNHVYLLHSKGKELDKNGRIAHLGTKVKVVEVYQANHITRVNGILERDNFDDIAKYSTKS